MLQAIFFGLSVADPSFSISSKKSVLDAAKSITNRAVSYYKPEADGAVTASSQIDGYGTPWFESAILWEGVMRNTQLTGQEDFVGLAVAAISNSSYGTDASFLGPPNLHELSVKLLGKWNDDIEWWSFPCLTAAEIYGPNAKMPQGANFIEAAENTANQVWENWNVATCNGGIFWSRYPLLDGPISNDNYKSTITNVQYVYLGAKLGRLTNNEEFISRSRAVYKWLVDIKLVTNAGEVLDGANAPNCDVIAPKQYSYNLGVLLMGLVELYRATKDNQYVTDAQRLYSNAKTQFTKNGLIVDQCEPSCRPQELFHKALLVKGLADFYSVADENSKTELTTLLETSILKMVETSCDDQWNCGNYWEAGNSVANFHSQLVALELVNAVLAVKYPGELFRNSKVPTYGIDPGIRSSQIRNNIGDLLLVAYLLFHFIA